MGKSRGERRVIFSSSGAMQTTRFLRNTIILCRGMIKGIDVRVLRPTFAVPRRQLIDDIEAADDAEANTLEVEGTGIERHIDAIVSFSLQLSLARFWWLVGEEVQSSAVASSPEGLPHQSQTMPIALKGFQQPLYLPYIYIYPKVERFLGAWHVYEHSYLLSSPHPRLPLHYNELTTDEQMTGEEVVYQ